MTTASVQ